MSRFILLLEWCSRCCREALQIRMCVWQSRGFVVSVAVCALRGRAAPSRLLAPPNDPQAIVVRLAYAWCGWPLPVFFGPFGVGMKALTNLVGRSPSAVIGVRMRLGLPAVHNHVAGKPWSHREVRLLGTVPDQELAKRLGRSPSAVVCARLRFGRPKPPGQRPRGKPWTQRELNLLGTEPDAKLARRFGRTIHAVKRKRSLLSVNAAVVSIQKVPAKVPANLSS
jgi:hypothetical protein